MSERTVSAANFCGTLAANVDNRKMDDADFRELVRNTLPIVISQLTAVVDRFPIQEPSQPLAKFIEMSASAKLECGYCGSVLEEEDATLDQVQELVEQAEQLGWEVTDHDADIDGDDYPCCSACVKDASQAQGGL